MSRTIMNITGIRIITSIHAVRIKKFTECTGALFHRNLWNQCFSSWGRPPDVTPVTPLPTQRRASLTPLRISLWKTLFCQHSNSKINCSAHHHSISHKHRSQIIHLKKCLNGKNTETTSERKRSKEQENGWVGIQWEKVWNSESKSERKISGLSHRIARAQEEKKGKKRVRGREDSWGKATEKKLNLKTLFSHMEWSRYIYSCLATFFLSPTACSCFCARHSFKCFFFFFNLQQWYEVGTYYYDYYFCRCYNLSTEITGRNTQWYFPFQAIK